MKTLFISFLLFSSMTSACFMPKANTKTDSKDLVQRSKRIYLVRAKDSQDLASPTSFANVDYKFEVLETLKGEPVTELTLAGTQFQASNEKNFANHRSKEFWKPMGGRAHVNPDCSVAASFEKGQRYIIFPDEPFHLKGFERIDADGDRWLAKIRTLVKTK